MGVRFILGGAGSGKTRTCLDEIAGRQREGGDGELIYIVPEQFSLQSEKNLIRATGGQGLFRAKVLSFQRLAYFVFSKTGGINRIVLEETGKQMLLRHIVMDMPKLGYFGTSAQKRGFLEDMSRTLSELYQYRIPPEQLAFERDRLPAASVLGVKLEDLHAIYTAYRGYLENEYLSADSLLDILGDKLGEGKLLEGAEIWIDGFRSFTPQELRIISLMFAMCRQVNIALDIGTRELGVKNMHDAYYESKNSLHQLRDLAEKQGIAVLPYQFLDYEQRFLDFPALRLIRNYFFAYNIKPHQLIMENVHITYAANIYDEAERLASAVVALVRDKGYRLREIGVICGALADYEQTLSSVFTRYGLPVFIDTKRDILSHPLVELARASLAVVGRGFKYEDVFRLLRSGLTPFGTEEIDKLENYVLAYGIRGKKWRMPFTLGFESNYEAFDAEEMNSLREKLTAMMTPLSESLSSRRKHKVADICTALYSFLEGSGACDGLNELQRRALLSGETESYNEHSSIWRKLIDILDKIVGLLGEEQLTIREFADILDAGLEGTSMGVAPPALDGLIIGDLRRTRLPQVKALFVIGVNEGKIPGRFAESGILTEEDRKTLNGMRMAPSMLEQAYEEQRLFYTNILRPSEYLWLSCVLGSLDGKEEHPSSLLDKVREILPNVVISEPNEIPSPLDRITAASPTFSMLAGSFREWSDTGIDPVYQDAWGYLRETQPFTERIEHIGNMLGQVERELLLSYENIGVLYHNRLRSSVSKIEKYIRCPFSYYTQYNLRAQERRLYEVENVDIGNVFHEALSNFSSLLREQNISWRDGEEQQLIELSEKSVDLAIDCVGNEIFKSSGRYAHFAKRVKDISRTSIWALTEHMRRGSFEMAFSEVGFSSKEGAGGLGMIEIPLENGLLQLEGRIDRVDIMEEVDSSYVKIVDYKSGNTSFSYVEAYYGLQLQLLIYMQAFVEKYGRLSDKEVVPAALLYFRLANPFVSSNAPLDDDTIRQELLKAYKTSGAVLAEEKVVLGLDKEISGYSQIIPVAVGKPGENGEMSFYKSSDTLSPEEFKALMQGSLQRAKQVGERILSGDIAIKPYKFGTRTGCNFCPYNSICKFEAANGRYNTMANIGKEEARQRLLGENLED